MVKLESLKKKQPIHEKCQKEKKIHTEFFSIFSTKTFFNKTQSKFTYKFCYEKKNWKCSKKKQNQKKIKSNCSEIIEKRGAINRDYTYIVFGKSKAYVQKQEVILPLMEKSFNKLKS